MKKIILVLIALALANCQSKSTDTQPEKTVTIVDEAEPTQPQTDWVWDPEPWVMAPDTAKPNILSIGDSISGGYLAALTRNMADYDVKHPNDNCRNSQYTLENIDSWLNDFQNNDIIVWNNGVWDSTADYWRDAYGAPPLSNYGTTPAQYESNLVQIARKMKATGARVIFLTTTHIQGPPFNIGYETTLNEIAKRVLPSEGVEVMDLYAVSLTVKHMRPNQWDVHYTREGAQVMADAIAKYIRGQ